MSERILDDFVVEVFGDVMGKRNALIEERIRLVVQPKPRWLPERLWRMVLVRLLAIVESEK